MAFSAIGAALVAGSTVVQGQKQRQTQRRAERRQAAAQREALTEQRAQTRREGAEQRRLNRRTPDVTSLLASEEAAANAGSGGSLLTGPRGVRRDRVTLGKQSLLGG